MLVRALLQTSLVLWLVQQTLQGGVKPQSVSWGRVLPARGVGVKPGGTGALGALGSRYGTKAMKTGIGRYPGAQLGVGDYRALGLGGRAGLRQGGYGAQVPYGANLGAGLPMGTGFANGLGLGHGGKRVYGAGLGTLPGYGALAGIGYPGARPGVSAADLGGPGLALGQAVQDLKRKNSRALGFLNGKRDGTLQPEIPMERGRISGPTTPELQAGGEVKSLNPIIKSSSLPLDKRSKELELDVTRREDYDPMVLKRKSTSSLGATVTDGDVRQQLPLERDDIRISSSALSQGQKTRDFDLSIQRNQQAQNWGPTRHLSGALESLVAHPHVGKGNKHLGHATPQAQGETTYLLPRSQAQDVRGHIVSLPQGQESRNYFPVVVDRQGGQELSLHGTIALEDVGHGSLNLHVQGKERYGPVIPGSSGAQGLGIASVRGQEAKGLTADGQKGKFLSNAERDAIEPKALSVPGHTGRNNQAKSYVGGAGNYLGASLGPGAYGPGLGQGMYLGGAAGKLGAPAALGQGYGEGTTGYLGAVAGNGFGGDAGAKALSTGYGNGYGDGYGAGLGYPAELADGGESKAGMREALGAGGYAGQVQGAYGGLGTGLESTGGKYGGGAAQVPYGNAPVIPTGLEGTGPGYGAQQAGYGAQLGATQEALGEHAGKYGGMNGALGNGYKG